MLICAEVSTRQPWPLQGGSCLYTLTFSTAGPLQINNEAGSAGHLWDFPPHNSMSASAEERKQSFLGQSRISRFKFIKELLPKLSGAISASTSGHVTVIQESCGCLENDHFLPVQMSAAANTYTAQHSTAQQHQFDSSNTSADSSAVTEVDSNPWLQQLHDACGKCAAEGRPLVIDVCNDADHICE